MQLTLEQLDRIVQAIQSFYPGWQSFDDPRFIADEIDYKKRMIAKANDQLSATELRQLRAGGHFDEILKRIESIGRTNLLHQAVPRAGDLGILYQPNLDKPAFCAALVELLHGEGETADRLENYLAWVEASGLPNRWTFPTYFLFMCHPDREIFVKPGVTAGFLDLLGFDEELRGGPSSAWYKTIRSLAHQLRDAFAARGARDMVDIQSAIFVAGRKGGTRYWKISPKEGALLWDDWREGGHASIGWEKLGDVSKLTRSEFDNRRRAIEQEDKGYTSQGAGQVWTFSRIREGDQIVANRGMSEVVGIGTVTGPYTFQTGIKHGHRLPVQWTDLQPRAVNQRSWSKTLIPLSREQFQEILDGVTTNHSFEDLRAFLRSKGLYFPAEVVSNYLLALQTKRFVILTGISGTGKTQLALSVARYFQPRADSCTVEAVRPDWTDHRGLLGYFNPLLGRYVSTPFLDLVLRARSEEEEARQEGRDPQPFFAVLDEMNLARVEHYFSDFLSALESGEALRLHDEDGIAIPRSLNVPRNLFFTGTVNVDESTYMFSPKVLDRAFTLELNEVDLDGLSSLDGAGDGLRLDRFPERLVFRGSPCSADWEHLDQEPKRIVKDLNDLLAQENRHFGYRVATEIARFVTLAGEQGNGEEGQRAALDLALLQKVLPKLHGTQQELEELLGKLLHFGSEATLARFTAKIERMRRRLERQGFTSFIE